MRKEVSQGVTILGSTGSVGMSTLQVIKEQSENFHIIALTAFSQVEKMFEQCQYFKPQYAVMADESSAQTLRKKLEETHSKTKVLAGGKNLEYVASLPDVEIVMAAIVGVAGLSATLAAITAGKTVLLANKESLVVGGTFFMDAVKKYGATLLPIDSEHNAIFQCLPETYRGDKTESGIRRILLTASGGPFRTMPALDMRSVTPDQACAHPKWKMGRKISVDCATMMNKGLEVIEAHFLFHIEPEDIQIVVHPQSIIHSMVEYTDGSVIAQLSNPDMKTPIAHALGYPQRLNTNIAPLDFFKISQLTFEEPDFIKFPCLQLAYKALKEGAGAPAILNAANEIAVEAFLKERIRFVDIPLILASILEHFPRTPIRTLADIIHLDEAVRKFTEAYIMNQMEYVQKKTS